MSIPYKQVGQTRIDRMCITYYAVRDGSNRLVRKIEHQPEAILLQKLQQVARKRKPHG